MKVPNSEQLTAIIRSLRTQSTKCNKLYPVLATEQAKDSVPAVVDAMRRAIEWAQEAADAERYRAALEEEAQARCPVPDDAKEW